MLLMRLSVPSRNLQCRIHSLATQAKYFSMLEISKPWERSHEVGLSVLRVTYFGRNVFFLHKIIRHCLKAYWEMVHENEANINLLFMPHKKNEASFPENPLEGFSSYWKCWLFNHCIRSPGTSTWPLLRINTLLKNLTCILIIKIIHTHGRKSKIKYKQKIPQLWDNYY